MAGELEDLEATAAENEFGSWEVRRRSGKI